MYGRVPLGTKGCVRASKDEEIPRINRGMTLRLVGRQDISETSEKEGREWIGKRTKKGELKLSSDYLKCV